MNVQDLRGEIIKKINFCEKTFKAPLPLYLLSQNTQDSKETLTTLLQDYNTQGNELISLTKNFYYEIESTHKTLDSLQSLVQSSNIKKQQLESQLKEKEALLKDKTKQLLDSESKIQELKETLSKSSIENSELSEELEFLKKMQKKTEEKQKQEINEIIDLHKKDREDLQKTIKKLELDLEEQENYFTENKEIEKSFTKRLSFEMNLSEELRQSIINLKNKITELEKKIEHQKIKKSKYKDQCLGTSGRCNKRNQSTQTSERGDDTVIEQRSSASHSHCSELRELEEEQSMSISKNMMFDFGGDMFGKSIMSESLIMILPPEKLKLSRGASYSIQPSQKSHNLSISNTLNYRVNPTRKIEDSSVVYAVPASQMKNNALNLNQSMSTKNAKFLMVSPKNSQILTPKSFSKFQFKSDNLKTETWSESVGVQKDLPEAVKNFESPEIDLNPEVKTFESIPNDPIKDYFVKLCQSIKAKCNYSEKSAQIPTGKLYQLLISHKTPLYMWPDAIHHYLAKRLRS